MKIPIILRFISILSFYSIALAASSKTMTILPGKGFNNISIGDSKAKLIELLGKPTKYDGEYITYTEMGIQCNLGDNGNITAIHFFFRVEEHGIFLGKTEKGVNLNSSIDDVLKEYGKPEDTLKSVTSIFSRYPGMKETTLLYTKLGIDFTFWNAELASITVFLPR